mmetsp:Transcript_19124/g.33049  ORF Transcript_19124/g.33049 Transcript_19124/m.33049 type:complete len:228 (-) Transcript_19124:859-1542(-)
MNKLSATFPIQYCIAADRIESATNQSRNTDQCSLHKHIQNGLSLVVRHAIHHCHVVQNRMLQQIHATSSHQLLLELHHTIVRLARSRGQFLSRRVRLDAQKVQQVYRPAENFHIAIHLIVRVNTHNVTQQRTNLLRDQRLQQKAINRITFVDRVGDDSFEDVNPIHSHRGVFNGMRGEQGHQQFDHFNVDDLFQGYVGVLNQRTQCEQTISCLCDFLHAVTLQGFHN